jgi:protein phosphatase PTC1
MLRLISGVLAVTRSLGDASMKEFVVGSPYTTETTLDQSDEFLIVACDGVCPFSFSLPGFSLQLPPSFSHRPPRVRPLTRFPIHGPCTGAYKQLWDVCEDQQAVDLIRNIQDPQEASKKLLDHAMGNYSTDNLSVMVIRFY